MSAATATAAANAKATAPAAARFELEQQDGGDALLRLQGAWTLANLAALEPALRQLRLPPNSCIDATDLQRMDSAAAWLLLQQIEPAASPAGPETASPTGVAGSPAQAHTHRWQGLQPAHERVLASARQRLQSLQLSGSAAGAADSAAAAWPARLLSPVGRAAIETGSLLHGHLNFLGATLLAVGPALMNPRRLRWRELTVQLEHTGLRAIPVVALVTALIGVVFAYLLGLQAEKYGANIFVVDGVGVGSTREFAPIIVAVVVAGRSGAAFTAQLGSMRLTEEIDAIRTLGLDVFSVLVVPRVLALMVALPLLVFVGDVMSLLGAMLVTQTMLDISPAGFAARLREALDLKHVLVGLVKAPFFALTIAVIATRMGMTVGRDTRAVGAATTSTVVQSIVAVILLDAAFAVLFQAMGI